MADQFDRDGRRWLESVAPADGFGPDDRLPDHLHEELLDELNAADTVDLALVHADDALLDQLAGLTGATTDARLADDDLNALLIAWRADVDAEPIGDLVDPDTALAIVQTARIRRRHRPRLLVPVAAAAAVLAIAFTGVGLAARDAQPGDTLWGLTRVLYADHARSVEAAASVRDELQQAKNALSSGNMNGAVSALSSARQELPAVSVEDGAEDLSKQHDVLLAQIPAPTPPGTSGTSTTTTVATTPSTPPSDTTAPSTQPTDPTAPTAPSTPPDTSVPTDPPTSSTPTETGSSPRDDSPTGGTSGGTSGVGANSNTVIGGGDSSGDSTGSAGADGATPTGG